MTGSDPAQHAAAIGAITPETQVRADSSGYLGTPPAEGADAGTCCIIITGAPASGKSTLSRRLAETLERSALLNGDQVHGVIVGGRVWALGEPRDEAHRQTRLGNQNLICLADNCAAAGFTPVIDWIIPDADQLAQFVDGLAPLPVWLIVLDPGAEACRERNLQREDRFDFDGYDELVGGMREGFGSRAWWITSTDQSAEGTLQLMVDRARPSAAAQ